MRLRSSVKSSNVILWVFVSNFQCNTMVSQKPTMLLDGVPPDGPKIVDDLVRECLRARRNSLAISIIMLMITESKKAIVRGRRSQIAALRSRALRGLRETDVVGKYDGERVLCILPGADIEGAIVAADR